MEATEAGQRSIEHLSGRFYGVLLGCSSREAEMIDRIRRIVDAALKSLTEKKDPEDSEIFRASLTKPLLDSFNDQKAAALLPAFRRNNTWQVPTLVGQPIREAMKDGRLRDRGRVGGALESISDRTHQPLWEVHAQLRAGDACADYSLTFKASSV